MKVLLPIKTGITSDIHWQQSYTLRFLARDIVSHNRMVKKDNRGGYKCKVVSFLNYRLNYFLSSLLGETAEWS